MQTLCSTVRATLATSPHFADVDDATIDAIVTGFIGDQVAEHNRNGVAQSIATGEDRRKVSFGRVVRKIRPANERRMVEAAERFLGQLDRVAAGKYAGIDVDSLISSFAEEE